MHLIIDGYDCAPGPLMSDREALLRWLGELPQRIEMSVLVPAMVERIEPPRCARGDEGLSGVVVICESHIGIHTWPAKNELQADIYSCRPFDAEEVLALFIHDFGIGDYDAQVIPRRKRG